MNTNRTRVINTVRKHWSISRVRVRQQLARDNAVVLAAGLQLPSPALRGRSALHRRLACDAYAARLEMIFRATYAA
jgi:CDP-diacylglycerol pyrophosphatase